MTSRFFRNQLLLNSENFMTVSRRKTAAMLPYAAFAVFTLSQHASAQSKDPYPGLEAYIANAAQTWGIPGLAVAIVRNDSVIYAKGFGVLSVGSKTPVNESTLFEIGSSTKAFTATAVAMLVSDGKMQWDQRLTDFLPDFRMSDPVANASATLRDALSHRTGIARGELVWLASGIGRDEVLHRLRFLKPESLFRTQFSYQNMLFLAAGQAVGKAAGSSWDDVIRQRIFTPLGMTSSAPTYTGVRNPNITRGHGIDHDTAFIKPPFDADNIAPAGAILSNAVDMAQWLRFQLNDGKVNGKQLLSSAALRETHTSQMLVPPGSLGGGGMDSVPTSHFSTYGFGWIIEDYRGNLVWQHGGNTEGMTAAVGMLPNKKFGVVVLSSMGQASLPGLLQRYIFDLELGVPKRDLSAEARTRFVAQHRRADSVAKVQEAKQKSGAQSPIPLSAFVGTFADSLYGTVNIVMKDGQLELERGTWRGKLEFLNANNFLWYVPKSAPVPPLIIKFEVAADNTVTGLFYGLGAEATLLSRVKPRPANGQRNGVRGGR